MVLGTGAVILARGRAGGGIGERGWGVPGPCVVVVRRLVLLRQGACWEGRFRGLEGGPCCDGDVKMLQGHAHKVGCSRLVRFQCRLWE